MALERAASAALELADAADELVRRHAFEELLVSLHSVACFICVLFLLFAFEELFISLHGIVFVCYFCICRFLLVFCNQF